MNVFIGGAWPYANGSLHLGHIASLLPGDILARYFRLAGRNVLYVSGSDCNGTPIAIRAKEEQTTPKQIADYYHKEFVECFSKLGFTYDLYTRTDSSHHHQIAQKSFWSCLKTILFIKKKLNKPIVRLVLNFYPTDMLKVYVQYVGMLLEVINVIIVLLFWIPLTY